MFIIAFIAANHRGKSRGNKNGSHMIRGEYRGKGKRERMTHLPFGNLKRFGPEELYTQTRDFIHNNLRLLFN